jgi:AbrB family looped-hinge helix DNA binding protein
MRRGQITIPKNVRARLGLRPGDRVEFVVEDDRALVPPVPREPVPFRAYSGALSAIDVEVISALWSHEPTASRMAELLEEARSTGRMVVSAPVFAELMAYPGASAGFVEDFLQSTRIEVHFDLGEAVWRCAADGYSSYADRRRQDVGATPKRLFVDFVIGAHAWLECDRLLTLDPARYRTAFGDLQLVSG